MYQKCPNCDGSGVEYPIGITNCSAKPCSVCNGNKIISALTGLPPDYNIEPISMPPRILGSNPGCPLCNGSGQYKIGNFGGTAVEYIRCPCQDRAE